MGYIVTAPLVVAHTENGDAYVFEGGELPENTDAEQVKQLLESEMVEKQAASRSKSKADES